MDQLDDVFALSFDAYLSLSEKVREGLQLRAYLVNRSWVDKELEQRRAAWLLVCGGNIIESGATLAEYPSRAKLAQIGAERGRVPLVFVREPWIEDSVSLPTWAHCTLRPVTSLPDGERGC